MAACFMFCFCISATAQNKNYIGLELLGNTGSYYSINLIKDFIREDKKSFFGVRAGLSILPGQESFSERHTEFYFPISLHYAVFNHLELETPKTLNFIKKYSDISSNDEIKEKVLVISSKPNLNLQLSLRNLTNFNYILANQLNVTELAKANVIILDDSSFDIIKETYCETK